VMDWVVSYLVKKTIKGNIKLEMCTIGVMIKCKDD